ncbi:proprotein convertase P-domain-containing protein [Pseudoalteromonas sp. SSDWG2]|uniref:proprotein convertase P-domain-containing protein n=1 Tax=Pseudoalteromonas sp. SSDWG2 TaxID=3139391 RepID=UPI003BAAEA45
MNVLTSLIGLSLLSSTMLNQPWLAQHTPVSNMLQSNGSSSALPITTSLSFFTHFDDSSFSNYSNLVAPSPNSLNSHVKPKNDIDSDSHSLNNAALFADNYMQTINAGETATFAFCIEDSASSGAHWNVSVAAALAGSTLSKTRVSAGEQIVLHVPTKQSTQFGKYVFTVTASKGEEVKQSSVALNVIPHDAHSYTFTNSESVVIEDNSVLASTSEIFVPYHLNTFALEVSLMLKHSWRSDLEVVLVSPIGQIYTLHDRDGGSMSDINQLYNTNVFNGQNAYGTWTLQLRDKAPGNIGTLNHWQLHITGFNAQPSPLRQTNLHYLTK